MTAEIISNLKRRLKLAKLDNAPATVIRRLEELLVREQETYARSRQPGSSRTVAEEAADTDDECE